MSSDNEYGSPSGQHNSTIEYAENAKVNGVSAKKVWNLDSSGNLVSPVDQTTQSDEAILLRRIVKLLESNAVVDINNRQKVVIDGITNGVAGIGTLVPGADSGAGSPTTNWPTRLAPIQQPSTLPWLAVWTGPVDQRFQIIDQARLVYNQSIRSHLVFT